jgi:hypothetical protein
MANAYPSWKMVNDTIAQKVFSILENKVELEQELLVNLK